MISHYYTKQGEGAGMRMLKCVLDEYWKDEEVKHAVEHEDLLKIIARLDRNESLPKIAKEFDIEYHNLRRQLRRAGYKFKRSGKTVKPQISDIEPFAQWLAIKGFGVKKKDGDVAYNIRFKDSTRFIKVVDGEVRLGQGLLSQFLEFRQETGRAQ